LETIGITSKLLVTFKSYAYIFISQSTYLDKYAGHADLFKPISMTDIVRGLIFKVLR